MKRRWKILSILALATVVAVAFAGCGRVLRGEVQDGGAGTATTELSGKITMNGSTSMAKVCQALGEAFQVKYPKVTVEKSGTGSGDAPHAVRAGTALLGDLSRSMKESENPAEFEQVQIAVDGIVVAVNRNNPVKDLTTEQIGRIFSGEITNWKDVGGTDSAITLLGREASSGTRDGFESLFHVENCSYAAELTSNGEMVTRISSDPGSIGYLSLDSLNETIHGLNIDGVEPTEENILNGTYQIQRPFLQIYKKGSDSELIQVWFAFLQSDEGKKIIRESGLIVAS